jgi:hypothetical protein
LTALRRLTIVAPVGGPGFRGARGH